MIHGQSSMEGILYESKTLAPIVPGTVALWQNGGIVKGAETDSSGHYVFN